MDCFLADMDMYRIIDYTQLHITLVETDFLINSFSGLFENYIHIKDFVTHVKGLYEAHFFVQ